MDLSVITVTWNSKEKIGGQIESVQKGTVGFDWEEIIVDNASTDGTADFIKQKYPQIKLIANDQNLGFAGGNNQGFKQAQGDWILFLNPDMQVETGGLKKILDWLKNRPDVGLVGCKLVNEKGEFNKEAGPRRFPTVLNQLAIIFKLPKIFPGILNSYLMKGFDLSQEQEVDSVRGSFMLVRRELLNKLGWGFDPRYFIWFEDVDLCREIKRLGYKVFYTPIVSCVDFVGQSFKQRASFWKQKNFTLSMLTYFQKWEPWYKWMWVFIARTIILPMAWLREKIWKK
ncbi:MAG: glycosyltransferase family 2 protein [Candidatus Magasanikbacteria bacterium]|nr:glycosyltransferase family 2 protein [Candidatus Magasanikbacteria bacterium]